MDWTVFLRDYGLPISMLVGMGFLIIKGYLVPGITHQDAIKQRDRALELVYEMAEGLKPVAAAIAVKPPTRGSQ